MKIILTNKEPSLNSESSQLAQVILERIGLEPRKKGATDKMHRTLVELYERAKKSAKEKNPTLSIMTVEEMGTFAGITRQTMYDYLKRWLELDIITKTSYVGSEQKVIIGYKLNGSTLETAFQKAQVKIQNNLNQTISYVNELQRILKNEKISQTQRMKESNEPPLKNNLTKL
jgi:hypothetical protein